MVNDIIPHNPEGEIILYTSEDGNVQMDVRIDGNTVWLTQQQMAQLYGKAKSTISEHITHIFEERELDPQVVVREFRTTTQHGAIVIKEIRNSRISVVEQAYIDQLEKEAKNVKKK